MLVSLKLKGDSCREYGAVRNGVPVGSAWQAAYELLNRDGVPTGDVVPLEDVECRTYLLRVDAMISTAEVLGPTPCLATADDIGIPAHADLFAGLERVSELTAPPIVGSFYWVECVELGSRWWPVTGPVHADPDLGAPMQHLHYDVRFLSDDQLMANARTAEGLMRRLGLAAADADNVGMTVIHASSFVTTWRRRRCTRLQLDFPTVHYLDALERQHAKSWVKKDCRTCPHRGLPLTSLPPDAEGGVVCPGHGLRWNVTTGHLMPRRRA